MKKSWEKLGKKYGNLDSTSAHGLSMLNKDSYQDW